MKGIRTVLQRKLTYAVLLLLVGAFVLARKIVLYAADPSGEKACPPLLPSLPGSSSGQTAFVETVVPASSLLWAQRGGTINDASCLNTTPVYGIVRIEDEEELRDALRYAQERKLKVSIAGVKHSMGGHAFARDALVLDMRTFNKMRLDEDKRVLTVDSGATWHDI
ncbi:MAG: FAD-dependent oxidoreductase, partial [Acidobacteriota bacterium]